MVGRGLFPGWGGLGVGLTRAPLPSRSPTPSNVLNGGSLGRAYMHVPVGGGCMCEPCGGVWRVCQVHCVCMFGTEAGLTSGHQWLYIGGTRVCLGWLCGGGHSASECVEEV